MITLGLIGGIGSGKSTVAEMFRQFGAVVIDADSIGHRVLLFPEVKSELKSRWGDDVFGPDGELDRRKVAQIVFQPTESGRAELDYLQKLTHPLIGREIEKQIEQFGRSGEKVVVLDIPLLLEAGWNADVHEIVFVDAPEEVRMARVRQRGWTPEEFKSREAAQWPVDAKKQRADRIIRNTGNLHDVLDQIGVIWQNLVKDFK